jgi:GNAT superfamily N-acetyltransferase
LDEETADTEIAAQIAYFQTLGMSFEWKVYDHDRPVDLRQRLKARGFDIEEPEALMVLDLDSAPDFYWNLSLPPIERIEDAAGVEQLRQMEEAVWGTDHSWLNVRLVNDLSSTPDQLSVFGVCTDDRLVSAAWIYYHPPSRFASLWGGSTLPDYRKRGYYTALLVVRAREARQRGYRFLTVDASPMSRPILEKHGFQFLGFSTPCKWNVPA